MKKTLLLVLAFLAFHCANAQSNNAYGNNQKEVEPGVWAIYSGDINQDGVVDFFDQVTLDNDLSNFASGYVVSDLNGDAVVDFFDQVVLDNNVQLFVAVVSPLNGFRLANPSAPAPAVNASNAINRD